MKFNHLIIDPTARIHDALRVLEKSDEKILFVCRDKEHLMGSVTDGDVRRALLAGKDTSDSVLCAMNSNPHIISKSSLNAGKKIEFPPGIFLIPVVDSTGAVKEIYSEQFQNPRDHRPNTAVLMVGGLGTRLQPLTNDTPKPMLHVGGRPILQTIIERIASYGIKNFILCTNYKAEKIVDYFNDGNEFNIEITYTNEKQRLGTAGALSLIEKKLDHPFIVMNGDLLTDINFGNLLDAHNSSAATLTMCVREYWHQVPYGVVEHEGYHITKIIEKPREKKYVNAGIYVLNPETLDYVPRDRFFDMPDLVNTLLNTKKSTCCFPMHEYWLDIGRIEDFARANDEYRNVFS